MSSFDTKAWICLSLPHGPTLLEYCPEPSPFKPYVKRLATPGGAQVLGDSPPDHKHHHGLMFALEVNGVNFWEETSTAGREVPQPGEKPAASGSLGPLEPFCRQRLHWVNLHGKTLLVEKRILGVVVPRKRPVTLLTWRSELSAADGLASVKLGGHHYFGLGLRFLNLNSMFYSDGRFFNESGKPGEVVRGTERLVAAKWCAYTAKAEGKPVTVAIFDHPTNPRHPNKMFTMTSPFAYLSATLNLWKEPMVLKAGETLKLNYAVALWDGETAPADVQSLYEKWVGGKDGKP